MKEPTPEQRQRRQQIAAVLARFERDQSERGSGTDADTPVPQRLHHYTTLDGLTGIITSGVLWASDVRFVNDASELTYASELIGEEVVAAISESQAVHVHLPHLHPDVANTFQFGARPFVACFCEEGDLLSQWRGYRANETGYSLGFDLRGQIVLRSLNTVLRKVIYDPEEQRGVVRSVVRTWLKTVEALLDAGDVPTDELFPYPALWALQNALAEHHLRFKNPSFAEEREWRLIKLVDVQEEFGLLHDRRLEQTLLSAQQKLLEHDPSGPLLKIPRRERNAEGIDIGFRRSQIGLVPYVELPLRFFTGDIGDRLPLWQVIQGPSPSPGLSLESLGMYLESRGYGSPTKLTASQIPLRT